MIGKLKNWLRARLTSGEKSVAPPRPKRANGDRRRGDSDRRRGAEYVDPDPTLTEDIDEDGPRKNVLVRNKYQREDTGTHETLTIVDDSVVDSGEETGIDPYNTGNFDRSRNWDKRFRN